jgi:hypothetical protein
MDRSGHLGSEGLRVVESIQDWQVDFTLIQDVSDFLYFSLHDFQVVCFPKHERLQLKEREMFVYLQHKSWGLDQNLVCELHQ